MRFYGLICVLFALLGCGGVKNVDSGNVDSGDERLYLGTFTLIPSRKIQNAKPSSQIARVCYSYFWRDNYKSYKILNIENLLKKAKENTGKSTFKNVGIWQEKIGILFFWQRRCLILGV